MSDGPKPHDKSDSAAPVFKTAAAAGGKNLLKPGGGRFVKVAPAAHQHGADCDHDHDDHAGHDHAGHDHGHDDHAGHDHHDHEGHDHHGHDHGKKLPERPAGTRPSESGGVACQLDLSIVLPGETDDVGRFAKLEEVLEARRGISDVHLRKDSGRAEVCIHYDHQEVTLPQVLALVRGTGAEVAKRYLQQSWFIRGMNSAQSAVTIEHAVVRVAGVLSANVAYGAERLVIEYDRQTANLELVDQAVEALGYELEEARGGHACSHHAHGGGLAPRLELPLGVAAGGLLALGLTLEKLQLAPATLPVGLYAVSLACGGFFTVRDALNSVRQKRLDIETLMILAAVGAALLGAWFEGALLLFLFSLGHALEHRAMERARRAIEALGKLRPETALVMKDGKPVEVPVAEVQRDDRVMIRAGDRVPLDGRVMSGQSSFDQAAITGESVPVPKSAGDTVLAGTINLEASVEIAVTRLSAESAIARVMDMVIEAEAQKSPTQRFTQRLERQFVPIVLCAAPVFAGILLAMGESAQTAMLRATALLVAASPCALAISTPAAVLSAVGRAARGGVLMKGGAHLEALGKVRILAFDKTGTLTIGRPRLLAMVAMEGVSEALLLATAAAAEGLSSHPIARALVDGARERGLATETAIGCLAVHGKGIRSRIGEEAVEVGSLAMFDAPPATIIAAVSKLESEGKTSMVVRRGERFLGVLGVADALRPEAKLALQQIRALGIVRTVMLSGDNLQVARAIALEVGIDDPRAPLMPEGKVLALRELANEGGVAMVGDGVNDAPALAAASVGIAMGGAGSDVALETADVVLMGDDLTRLPFAVGLAREATRVVRQNLMVSIGVSAVLVLASILGWVRISEAVILHEGSTLLVVANGLRLLAWKHKV